MTHLDLQQKVEQLEELLRFSELSRKEMGILLDERVRKCCWLEVERDILQQQVNALEAEKEKYLVECAAAKIAVAYAKGGKTDFTLNTPNFDAIKRQWMASVAKDAALRIRTCKEEFPEASWDIVEECAILAESQPEEKCQ